MSAVALIKLSMYPGFVKSTLGAITLFGSSVVGWFTKPITIKNPEFGNVLVLKTTDSQWRFLYHLSTKVFEYLKSQNDPTKNIKAKDKSDLIEWLKDKFSKNTIKTEWKGFKDLCSKSIKEDQIPSFMVKIYEIRLCYLGEKLDSTKVKDQKDLIMDISRQKGNLKHLNFFSNSPYKPLNGFKNWNISNYDFWKEFISDKGKELENDVNNNNWDSKFEEWYQTAQIKRSSKGKNDGINIKDALSTSSVGKAKGK